MKVRYSADGQKLTKAVSSGTTKQYCNGIEYNNTDLEAIYHEEGRVVKEGAAWQYQYHLTDHLGNVRVVLSDTNGDHEPEILQDQAYYPFGLEIADLSMSNLANPNDYKFNGKELNEEFGLDLTDFGNRWQDPAIARFTSVDRFAEKYQSMSPHGYAANNPIKFIDVNGDSIRYANTQIEAYVNQFTSETITKKNGKVKKNRSYNEGFAKLIQKLEDASDVFVITDDASKMKSSSSDEGVLGEFNVSDDGTHFNIVVPNFSSGTKAGLTTLMGGRTALLAEEVYHANQYLEGDVTKEKGEATFGLKAANGNTVILIEADAKIWVANSGMAALKSTRIAEGYNISTMPGLIKDANGDRKAVGRLLLYGTKKNYLSTSGGNSKTVTYPPSYSPLKK